MCTKCVKPIANSRDRRELGSRWRDENDVNLFVPTFYDCLVVFVSLIQSAWITKGASSYPDKNDKINGNRTNRRYKKKHEKPYNNKQFTGIIPKFECKTRPHQDCFIIRWRDTYTHHLPMFSMTINFVKPFPSSFQPI